MTDKIIEPVIRVENLEKTYYMDGGMSQHVLKGVSFSIHHIFHWHSMNWESR